MKKGPLGFTLIEVLISLMILSLIFLDFDVLQIVSLRENHNAYLFNVAVNQMHSIIEHLHGLNGHDEFLDEQIDLWNQENIKMLPGGRGHISGNFPTYQVTLFWGEKKISEKCDANQFGKINCLTERVRL